MSAFWFNRMVEHWTVPQRLDLPDQVRRGRIQVVQTGTLGPQFYGLAGDPTVDRHWAGMPLVGVRENLEMYAHLVPRLQEAGAKVIGQMSMAWHYGDHEEGKGLFGAWDDIWTDDLLGPAPSAADEGQQRRPDGSLRRWDDNRPFYTYSGCITDPRWQKVMKAMAKKAIALGVDGIMVHHHFENFCACSYCRECLHQALRERFDAGDLVALYGTVVLEELGELKARASADPELRRRLDLEVKRATQRQRKRAFDAVFVDYARRLKPDLILSQWCHKYDFRPDGDERHLLPTGLWCRDEDYIWYSQGAHKYISDVARGYLTDMGLPARYLWAAGGGRPFLLNKYDSRRWRLSIGEGAANHFATLGVHWSGDGDPNYNPEDYLGPVLRYHRFLADREALIHPARPWSQLGLIFPRRAELEDELDCGEPLKRIGRVLEDAQVPFDMLLDEQLLERIDAYPGLLLPHVERLSDAETEVLERYVERGGKLVFSGDTGRLDVSGKPHGDPLFARWRGRGPEGVEYIEDVPCEMREIEIRSRTVKVYHPISHETDFARDFLRRLEALMDGFWVQTDAPFFVRMRAWLPEQAPALVLHWVNYRQDEHSAVEVPVPTGPIQVDCRVPDGRRVDRVEWLYPESSEGRVLEHDAGDGRIRFAIPSLIVYGMSVLHLQPADG